MAPRSPIFDLGDVSIDEIAAADPIAATMIGIPGYETQLTDYSPSGSARRGAILESVITRAEALSAGDEVDRLARDVMIDRGAVEAEIITSGEEARTFSILWSPIMIIRQVFELMACESAADAAVIAERLAAVPGAIESWRETLDELVASSTSPARRQILGIAEQCDAQADGGIRSMAARFAEQAGADIDGSGLGAASESAAAALAGIGAYLREKVAPGASEDDRVGRDRYSVWARYYTGASLDLEETYAWGWEDLSRITNRMHALARSLAPNASSLREVADHLDADPAHRVVGVEEILESLRGLCAQAIEQLDGKVFDVDPRIRFCDARVAPEGSAAAPYYIAPSDDLSRPGITWLPTLGETEFSWWRLVTTWYHESVPGHHLQLGTATVSKDSQSRFHRTIATNSGYCEGWALYAERLMDELGYFSEPASEYGYLSSQALRAARVVVDIGLHLGLAAPRDLGVLGELGDCSGKVWSPEMAVALLEERAIIEPVHARSEVDRYLGVPGQAISYKVGERAWLAVRESATKRLGASFDLKAFHNHALSTGSLGLDHFARELARWPG
jgi:uncharacterized protein (DUF885 family)